MEKGFNWNKAGTNPVENKIIADNAFKMIEDNSMANKALQEDDIDYINYTYPKTNDDFNNEEITNRRIIEGHDVYDKLIFSTEGQNDLKRSLEDKKVSDYNKVWNEYENLVSKTSNDPEYEAVADNLSSYKAAIDNNTRFNLQKGAPLTDEQKQYIEEKVKEVEAINKKYDDYAEQYGKSQQALVDKYETWNTDPSLN